MDISVIIVSFNTAELLAMCLKSLEIALKDLRAEVFVVDNNSADESVNTVKKEFSWVNLIANKDNVGFSKANNQAIRQAKGKYILVLNPDTKVQKESIKKMINFMDNNKNVGISTCRVELPNGKLDLDCRRHFPSPWRSLTHFSGLSKIFRGSKLFDSYYMGYLDEKREHEVDSCVGAFMMIRKNLLDKVGNFDEEFFFYGEDLDLCWRFKEAGYKVMYTPITKILHHKGAASGMKPTSKHFTKASRESKRRALSESVRAMELFYKKHYRDKYPFFINLIVLLSQKVLKIIRILSA